MATPVDPRVRCRPRSPEGDKIVFVDGVAPASASGLVKEIYDEDVARLGYLPNYTRLFSLRPEVSKSLDSMGAEADEAHLDQLGAEVAAELAVGRPFQMTMRRAE